MKRWLLVCPVDLLETVLPAMPNDIGFCLAKDAPDIAALAPHTIGAVVFARCGGGTAEAHSSLEETLRALSAAWAQRAIDPGAASSGAARVTAVYLTGPNAEELCLQLGHAVLMPDNGAVLREQLQEDFSLARLPEIVRKGIPEEPTAEGQQKMVGALRRAVQDLERQLVAARRERLTPDAAAARNS
jgi:hypothetical protein